MEPLAQEGFMFQFLRMDTRYSQSDLARFLAVDPAEVSRWERGISPIPFVYLLRSLRAFGSSLSEYLDLCSLELA